MTTNNRITVRVFHDFYGCDTGCCGHSVEITLPDGTTRREFDFDHPDKGDSHMTYARREAEEVIRRKWPSCLTSIDWASLQCDEVRDGDYC